MNVRIHYFLKVMNVYILRYLQHSPWEGHVHVDPVDDEVHQSGV